MRILLEPLFRAAYAAYRVVRWAFRFADLNVSVVWAAVYYTGASLFYLVAVYGFESWTFSWVHQCLFPPQRDAWFDRVGVVIEGLPKFVRSYPLISAFVVFVAGQTAAVYFLFTTIHWVMTFKLTYLLGSDKYGHEEAYTPFDGETSEADPLTF